MPILKQKMLDCDILFFSSPVYLWSMSGIAKSVLDRLSYWTHRYELLGKPCAVFSTTSSTYGTKVTNDLETLIGFTGAVIVNGGYADGSGLKTNPEETAQRLMELYRNPASGVTKLQQNDFLPRIIAARRLFKEFSLDDERVPDEMRVLEKRGITDCVLISEAIEALCPKK